MTMAVTNDQLTAINQHLRKENWLLNEDLIAELIDHYANGIAERIGHGMAFDIAMRDVHQGFGGRPGLLKMEETYQIQQHRQIGRLEWQIVRSFFGHRRGSIALAIFGCLFALNIYEDQRELVNTSFLAGTWFVAFSLLANMIQTIVFFYKNRRESNVAVMQPSSMVYGVAYFLSLALLLLNKYALPNYHMSLNLITVAALEATLETLCIIYYIAIALVLKQTLFRNQSKQSKIA